MTEIQRVIKVVDWLIFKKKVKSRKELAEKMGYTESSMSQILNEKVALSDRFIKKLSIVDSLINEDWIKSGDGEMLDWPENLEEPILKEQTYYGGGDYDMISMPREVFDQISKLTETVLSQQRVIESLEETIKKLTSDNKHGENQDKGK